MPGFLQRRLTYANVVATLALFVALGGTATAAIVITSTNVKDRSLLGRDVRLNALTGAEVNEAKLTKVPKAATADTATSAVTASSADHASTADSATSAGNASTLGGQAASSFDPASNSISGSASASAAAGTTVLDWPAGSARLVIASGGTPGTMNLALQATDPTVELTLQGLSSVTNTTATAGIFKNVTPGAPALALLLDVNTSYMSFSILRTVGGAQEAMLAGSCSLADSLRGFSGRIICSARSTSA